MIQNRKMKFIATVEKGKRSQMDAIVEALKSMGVRVEQVLKFTGIITGTTKDKTLQEIKIKGIKSVEKDKAVHATD